MGLCRFQKYLYILEIQITLLFGNLSRLGPVCQHEHRAQYVTFQNIQGKRNNYKVTQMQKRISAVFIAFSRIQERLKQIITGAIIHKYLLNLCEIYIAV